MRPTATRKQREIAERERLILETARGMLIERGYLGLTMDRIADAIEYSKGTVYQHFGSKEDLIAALAATNQDKMAGFFERGATFNGKSRIPWTIAANSQPAQRIPFATAVALSLPFGIFRATFTADKHGPCLSLHPTIPVRPFGLIP